jgi:hypothetical protein
MNKPVVSDPDKRALVIRIEIGGSLMVNYKIKLGVVIVVLATALLAGCGLINAVGSTPEETTVSDGTLPEWIFWSHYDTAEPDKPEQEINDIGDGNFESDNNAFQSTGTTAPAPALAPEPATQLTEPEQAARPSAGTMKDILDFHKDLGIPSSAKEKQEMAKQKEQAAKEKPDQKEWWEWD